MHDLQKIFNFHLALGLNVIMMLLLGGFVVAGMAALGWVVALLQPAMFALLLNVQMTVLAGILLGGIAGAVGTAGVTGGVYFGYLRNRLS